MYMYSNKGDYFFTKGSKIVALRRIIARGLKNRWAQYLYSCSREVKTSVLMANLAVETAPSLQEDL
jgi:hypothetical protein